MLIVPVGVEHVGCVIVVLATAGVLVTGSIITGLVTDVHPDVFFTVIVYDPDGRFSNIIADWKVVPSMLYVRSAPNGELIVILPVGVAHVGCIAVTPATAGAPGTAFIIIGLVTEVQPSVFFTVTVYSPG